MSNMGKWTYTYFLKDHLGNTRAQLACDSIGISGSTAYTVAGTTDYYPFGMEISPSNGQLTSGTNPYLYNGKEMDRMNGLNMYDYGARWRGGEVPSWSTMDPLCEKHYNISPYAYCANNPVNMIDPDGRLQWPVNKTYNGNGRRHENNFGAARPNGRTHKGIDINYTGGGNTDRGAPIVATHDGTITKVGNIGDGDSGGNRIKITSSDGTVSTSYMHLDKVGDGLKNGATVTEGQQIGTMGGSGKTGETDYTSHLHYEISVNGEKVNPSTGPNSLIDPQKLITPQQPEAPIDGGQLPTVTVTSQCPSTISTQVPPRPVLEKSKFNNLKN